jgi:benzoyl-CoA reductase/2-hydroxyglutaryl-CoA dehydratase subunit BcrC/BadD/HgdB
MGRRTVNNFNVRNLMVVVVVVMVVVVVVVVVVVAAAAVVVNVMTTAFTEIPMKRCHFLSYGCPLIQSFIKWHKTAVARSTLIHFTLVMETGRDNIYFLVPNTYSRLPV